MEVQILLRELQPGCAGAVRLARRPHVQEGTAYAEAGSGELLLVEGKQVLSPCITFNSS